MYSLWYLILYFLKFDVTWFINEEYYEKNIDYIKSHSNKDIIVCSLLLGREMLYIDKEEIIQTKKIKIVPKNKKRKLEDIKSKNIIKIKRPKTKNGNNSGRWTKEEHNKFLNLYKKYGKNWKNISLNLKTRSTTQIRSHAQKCLKKFSI